MSGQQNLSRRRFLNRSITSLAGLAVLPRRFGSISRQADETAMLGRVLFNDIPTFDRPDSNGIKNGTYQFNQVIPLYQPTKSIADQLNGEIWFPTEKKAFIQSKNIQIVRNSLNTPEVDVPKAGRLGVITVPLTEAINADKQNAVAYQLFFYGSVHWLYGMGENQETGKLYYLVIEDRWNESYYVDATHVRVIADDELAPIAPVEELDRKQIIVDTNQQMLYAYEDGGLVMACGVSTGMYENGSNLSTPAGEYFINYKRPTRHMVHSDKIGVNDSELYGVPWVSYFTDTGIAFHGTYWHNDYSQPRSHGCVNMPIQAAKWLYLWSDPIIQPRAKKHVSRYGTSVKVI